MPIMILPCGREDNVLSLYDYISVLYAPYVGALGLDMARKTTREDLFAQQPVKSSLGINHPIPWYPEAAGYNVCLIEDGKSLTVCIRHMFVLSTHVYCIARGCYWKWK